MNSLIEQAVAPEQRTENRVGVLTPRARFLRACHCEKVDRPPVWLMRQAGRSLPEYRQIKEKHSFLEIVQTPELAAEVTLQPVRRFGLDAAILFSDILVVPEALGQGYRFREQGGVEMACRLESPGDLRRLNPKGLCERLDYVAEALRLVRSGLNGSTALLGFAGSPWTLANYMLEGGSSRRYTRASSLFHSDRALFDEFLALLTEAVTEFLALQIEGGVDAIQIFDSHGGLLPPEHFAAASGDWMQEIITQLGGRVPVIVFSRGTHGNWGDLAESGAQVIGVDWEIDLGEAVAALPARVAIQGNLDPALLRQEAPWETELETRRLLTRMRHRPGYIFNLGHGVPPDANLDCIYQLGETIADFQ